MTEWFEHVSERVKEGAIDWENDQFKLALCANADTPDLAGDEDLTDLTEIDYTNLSSRVLTVGSVSRSGGDTHVFLDDITLTAVLGAVPEFRWLVVYDDTTSPKWLVARKDLRSGGVDVTLGAADSADIEFDQSSGAFVFEEA